MHLSGVSSASIEPSPCTGPAKYVDKVCSLLLPGPPPGLLSHVPLCVSSCCLDADDSQPLQATPRPQNVYCQL